MMETTNNLDRISESLSNADKERENPSPSIGMMVVKTAIRWSEEAKAKPDPKPLWLSLWNEGEACVLFADTNLGKSILAVQIAESIAREKNIKVMYFDFELSDKQFQKRYTDEFGNIYQFSPNLYRVELDSSQMLNVENFEEAIIQNIEQCVIEYGVPIIIIDNISFLCASSEKGDLAGLLMIRLKQLQRSRGLSILVLAHTPKRNMTNPITQNDLAGSKKLMNFFDSGFAIGKSARDNKLRYIKQIKCRDGEFEYDADNVKVCSIEKKDSFLQFEHQSYTTEAEHLKSVSYEEMRERESKVIDMNKEGKSLRQISATLGISKSTVERYLKKGGKKDDE